MPTDNRASNTGRPQKLHGRIQIVLYFFFTKFQFVVNRVFEYIFSDHTSIFKTYNEFSGNPDGLYRFPMDFPCRTMSCTWSHDDNVWVMDLREPSRNCPGVLSHES